jgi:murein L,D-transpeptidase YafK
LRGFHRWLGVLITRDWRLLGVALLALLCAGVARADIAVPAAKLDFSDLPRANRVIVYKAERRLELWHNRDLLRSYKVALGLNPEGHKQEEGDFRTPEGRYRLAGRNERSDFFLSIAVSYPDQRDRERAQAAGVSPGGFIMVHGLPNQPRWPPEYYATRDWTDGCIALSNSDMMELWMLVGDNIPIDIRP